ncbi:unnamed protein product [Peronospora destructor]|uniref:tRNA threonylcarbamoyladenosine biosynthesis protein TsaE n=1 Tax=Peronospora destructor TaxID=86335 RepID=A0AAV0UNL1_9STRA|nr:unnamed protein product [Peronospora destructor]
MEMLGERLARGRQPGDVLFLRGDLGCGKTCLARGFCEGTYAAEGAGGDVADCTTVDLYRLDIMTEQDVTALGLIEAFERGGGKLRWVEWPERLDEPRVFQRRGWRCKSRVMKKMLRSDVLSFNRSVNDGQSYFATSTK